MWKPNLPDAGRRIAPARRRGLGLLLAAALLPAAADADMPVIERFGTGVEERWRFFTDGVMGGVSTGRMAILSEMGAAFARMTGDVSTANNGGFIQMRMDLSAPLPDGTEGVKLLVRGNGERYFVHLRSTAARAPWHYYQAGFEADRGWGEVRLPFSAFRASHGSLPETLGPSDVTSIGIVAYGRDHAARIDVAEVGVY